MDWEMRIGLDGDENRVWVWVWKWDPRLVQLKKEKKRCNPTCDRESTMP
jgi:hypothetical protein